jgi:hypothetical protein
MDRSRRGPALAFALTVRGSHLRITVDTSVPEWQEIDAVELVGTPPT